MTKPHSSLTSLRLLCRPGETGATPWCFPGRGSPKALVNVHQISALSKRQCTQPTSCDLLGHLRSIAHDFLEQSHGLWSQAAMQVGNSLPRSSLFHAWNSRAHPFPGSTDSDPSSPVVSFQWAGCHAGDASVCIICRSCVQWCVWQKHGWFTVQQNSET